MTPTDWITIAGIVVTAIVGTAGICATLIAGKAPEQASAMLSAISSKGVDVLLVALSIAGGLTVAFGTIKVALIFFASAAVIYVARFLSRPGPASRVEIFMVVLHCTAVAWISLADLLGRVLEVAAKIK